MTTERKTIETESDVALGVAELINADPRFGPILDVTGQPPLRRREAGFEALLRIITDQQISLSAGAAIWSRFAEKVGTINAMSLIKLSDDDLRATGQSGAKTKTMRAVASAILDGTLDLRRLEALDDEAAAAELMQVKGIGPWTADIYLLSCMGRSNVFPASDVALQTGAQLAFKLTIRPTAPELTAMAELWQPFRAIAARLLWSYYRHERMSSKQASKTKH